MQDVVFYDKNFKDLDFLILIRHIVFIYK